jgi:hypothetical protein
MKKPAAIIIIIILFTAFYMTITGLLCNKAAFIINQTKAEYETLLKELEGE